MEQLRKYSVLPKYSDVIAEAYHECFEMDPSNIAILGKIRFANRYIEISNDVYNVKD